MAHTGGIFIHQYIVDAFGAQTATREGKPIRVVFSLVGLYLYLEHDYTGRQVQLFHMKMAKRKISWPEISLPEDRGEITVKTVLETQPGQARDEMIKKWCEAVWVSFSSNRETIKALVEHYNKQ